MMKTIAIDFDGVIHKYSNGWQDGSIYDEPVQKAFESIKELMKKNYSVFIFSTRNPRQIKKWLQRFFIFSDRTELIGGQDMYFSAEIPVQIIPFWKKFWNEKFILGITKRKLPAHIYIDDRGYRFNNWEKTLNNIYKLLCP